MISDEGKESARWRDSGNITIIINDKRARGNKGPQHFCVVAPGSRVPVSINRLEPICLSGVFMIVRRRLRRRRRGIRGPYSPWLLDLADQGDITHSHVVGGQVRIATASRQMFALRAVVVQRFLPLLKAVPYAGTKETSTRICPARNDRAAMATEKAGNPLPLHRVFFCHPDCTLTVSGSTGVPPIQLIISEGAVQVEAPQSRRRG